MKKYKYPQPNTCDKCKHSDERNACTLYTKDKVEIWLTNQCKAFEAFE